MTHPVREMLDTLLAEAQRAAAGNPIAERETTEIAALVMQQALPEVHPSIVPTAARGVLLRAKLRHLTWKSTGILEPA